MDCVNGIFGEQLLKISPANATINNDLYFFIVLAKLVFSLHPIIIPKEALYARDAKPKVIKYSK